MNRASRLPAPYRLLAYAVFALLALLLALPQAAGADARASRTANARTR